MKHPIMRRVLTACLSVLMLCSTCLTASAEELSRSGWTATFTGSAIETNFRPEDLYTALCELQPGDSATLRVDVKNASSDYVQWYISNETLQSLEDTRTSARNGGYSYKLSYTSNGANGSADGIAEADRTAVLFDSDTIGGDGGNGLYEATENLDGFFHMCNMAPGGSGYVVLYVKLDGETQGNGYQKTLAKIELLFAVDTVPPKYVEVPEKKTETVTRPGKRIEIPGDPVYVIDDPDTPLSDIPQYTNVPQTGDSLKLACWSAAALALGIGGIVLVVVKRRKDRKEA